MYTIICQPEDVQNNTIEQIKDRLTISTIIGRHIQLKDRGGGEFLAHCPFHAEKTPSFTVSDSKRFYYCFGCNAHGDIITFTMNFLGIPYKEALSQLAQEAGVIIQSTSYRDGNRKCTQTDNSPHALLTIVSQYYHDYLMQHNKQALSYLLGRRISRDILTKYQVGFAPHKDLITHLKEYNKNDLVISGVLSEKDGRTYNPFSGRITFPIHDVAGKVIAFGARTLHHTSSEEAKYINSSDSEIFNKGSELYGLHFAQEWIKLAKRNKNILENEASLINAIKKNGVLIVEGYLDVLALASNRIGNVVASMGTALKVKQIESLWSRGYTPIICLDNDTAGLNAMIQLAQKLLPRIQPARTVHFLLLQGAKDPADLVLDGKEKFLIQLEKNTKDLSSFLFHETMVSSKVGHASSPEEKIKFLEKLLSIAGSIEHKGLSSEYRSYFKKRYYESVHPFLGRRSSEPQPTYNTPLAKATSASFYGISRHIGLLLQCILRYPPLLENMELFNFICELEIQNKIVDNLRNTILYWNERYRGEAFENFLTKFLNDVPEDLQHLNFTVAHLAYENLMRIHFTPQIPETIERIKVLAFHSIKIHELYELHKEIQETMHEAPDLNENNVEDVEKKRYDRLVFLKQQEHLIKQQLKTIDSDL